MILENNHIYKIHPTNTECYLLDVEPDIIYDVMQPDGTWLQVDTVGRIEIPLLDLNIVDVVYEPGIIKTHIGIFKKHQTVGTITDTKKPT